MLSLNLPECALSELLYADDLVLMSETIEGLGNKFLKWKKAFERKGLKVNLGKTKVMLLLARLINHPGCGVSVGTVHNDSTVSVVSFDIAGKLKQKVGVALPASAAPPQKWLFDE